MSNRRAAERAVIDAVRRFVPSVEHTADGMVETKWDEYIVLADALNALELIEATEHATPYPANAPATSQEAAEWMKGSVASLVGQVFLCILTAARSGAVGLTTDAIEVRLGRSHQTVSPRVTDLRDKGWITESGIKRKTRSGRNAVVWKPTNLAIETASRIKEWSW